MDRFDVCHAITAKWEGGYVNHGQDPGGPTNLGVTQAVYDASRRAWGQPTRSVKLITHGEALRIYREQYWNPTVKARNLRPGVDLATYDAAVNAGVSHGNRWLLASVGKADHITVQRICAARLSFKQGLAIWKTFGKGWTNRVVDIEAKGVAMALEADKSVVLPKPHLEVEAQKAKTKANYQDAGGAASGGSTVAPVGAENLDQIASWALTGFVVVAIGVAVFLVVRGRINRARAAAYASEAEKLP